MRGGRVARSNRSRVHMAFGFANRSAVVVLGGGAVGGDCDGGGTSGHPPPQQQQAFAPSMPSNGPSLGIQEAAWRQASADLA